MVHHVIFLIIVLVMWLSFVTVVTTSVSSFVRYGKVGRADSESLHTLVFAIKQANVALMDTMLVERSTPGGALYQRWLTFEEIDQLVSNPVAAAAVLEWLTENNMTIVWTSARMEYIKAEATIGRWEALLGAPFFQYEEIEKKRTRLKNVIHRTTMYTLPPHIQPHVHSVLNTVQAPPQILRSTSGHPGSSRFVAASHNIVDIALLKKVYGIDSCSADSSDPGISHLQQAVVETADQRFSFVDITRFQQRHHLPLRAPLDPYGYNTTQCRSTSTTPGNQHYNSYSAYTNTTIKYSNTITLSPIDYPCNEGNLNLQYMLAVAPCVNTIFLYVAGDDPFVDWITSFADLVDPPKVFTVPWYSIEQVIILMYIFTWFLCVSFTLGRELFARYIFSSNILVQRNKFNIFINKGPIH